MRTETFKTISVNDPFLDTTQVSIEDAFAFVKERDFKLVDGKWARGEKPTIFHVREVPNRLWETYVMAVGGTDEEALPERFRRAFECGVFRVENLVGADGVSVDWEPSTKTGEYGALMSREECYSRFSKNERAEIGSVIYAHSFLHRKIALCCRLPAFVLELLVARQFLRVEPSQNTASVLSSETPLPAQEAPPPQEAIALA